MVAVTVGAAAADGVCIDTPTPLSAKSTNKTGIQKGIFLIFHGLLSFVKEFKPQTDTNNAHKWDLIRENSSAGDCLKSLMNVP